MQALISYDESPPLGTPFRFFLTAPFFGILAGLLLLWSGPEAFASRWTPSVLALTHLLTAGFMLQIIVGALFQILPVVVGANVVKSPIVTCVIHIALTLGALFLAAAFQSFSPLLFKSSAVFCALGVAVFAVSAIHALQGVSTTNPTTQGLKVSLVGLGVTVILGVFLVISLGWSLDLPLVLLADIHLGWGLGAFVTVLLAAVSYVVVPMFQITPSYPGWFVRLFAFSMLGAVASWSVAEFIGFHPVSSVLGAVVVLVAAVFAAVTLKIQRGSKRARFDANQHGWRLAMLSGLASGAVWLASRHPAVNEWQEWPLLFGVLLLFGCFMTVMISMLYKIVPFLVWLHLQNYGQGKVIAPNMKKIIGEQSMNRQMRVHFAACSLLLLAVLWPAWFVYPAGVALVVANTWLAHNLLSAMSTYRGHQRKIDALIGSAASG